MAKLKRPSKPQAKSIAKTKPADIKPAETKPAETKLAKRAATAAAPSSRTTAPGKKVVAAPRATLTARRKQRVAVSHYREEDFALDGLRSYAKYRDLGVAAASGGLAHAHVIRLIGPCNANEVSKLHYHDAEFQLVYVLNGWVKTYMDGEGETTMRPGSCWTQPPRIKHMIRDYSDNCELLEVILPAEFKTVEIKN